jgi:hypothetical protein
VRRIASNGDLAGSVFEWQTDQVHGFVAKPVQAVVAR